MASIDARDRVMVPEQVAEAYAFSKLAAHLQMRADVQNIDQMILAGFCRNCLAKWCAPTFLKVPKVRSFTV